MYPRPPQTTTERRYALRLVKQRLHQASFREAVITAYQGRCALSGLPEPLLLDAAHIIADKDERLGHPVIPNGIPLSKIHHAATPLSIPKTLSRATVSRFLVLHHVWNHASHTTPGIADVSVPPRYQVYVSVHNRLSCGLTTIHSQIEAND